jgi:chromosome segregation ATPase
MKTLPSFTLCLLLSLCLALSSCKETQQMQKQLKEATVRITALQAELAQMETQMASVRSQLPAGTATEQGLKQHTVQLATGVVALETEIAQTQAAIQETQKALEAAKADLQTLRAKTPH